MAEGHYSDCGKQNGDVAASQDEREQLLHVQVNLVDMVSRICNCLILIVYTMCMIFVLKGIYFSAHVASNSRFWWKPLYGQLGRPTAD